MNLAVSDVLFTAVSMCASRQCTWSLWHFRQRLILSGLPVRPLRQVELAKTWTSCAAGSSEKWDSSKHFAHTWHRQKSQETGVDQLKRRAWWFCLVGGARGALAAAEGAKMPLTARQSAHVICKRKTAGAVMQGERHPTPPCATGEQRRSTAQHGAARGVSGRCGKGKFCRAVIFGIRWCIQIIKLGSVSSGCSIHSSSVHSSSTHGSGSRSCRQPAQAQTQEERGLMAASQVLYLYL